MNLDNDEISVAADFKLPIRFISYELPRGSPSF
jgi:hypothetical protein